MKKTVKIGLPAAVFALIASDGLAQPRAAAPTSAQLNRDGSVADGLATPLGSDVNVSVASYRYNEPGDQGISIHGTKVGGEYTGTLPLNRQRHWFAQIDGRGSTGAVTYDGWCSPFLIVPNNASPNGYELGTGDASPCGEDGDKDWYLEGRLLAGKDLIGDTWGFAPFSGIGLRHLSNGTSGVSGYRTDDYLYLPLGITARTRAGSRGALSFNLEIDALLHGWQKTRDSQLGGGDVPATATAPAFTIDGFSDVSFSQTKGWALRASAKYQAARHWSVEPYYVYWKVNASPPNDETVTFTVNRVSAREQLGFYEPDNNTHEFGVKLGFHF